MPQLDHFQRPLCPPARQRPAPEASALVLALLCALSLLLGSGLALLPGTAQAATPTPTTAPDAADAPWQVANAVRTALFDAQVQVRRDPTAAAAQVEVARAAWDVGLAADVAAQAPDAAMHVAAALDASATAAAAGDSLALAQARAQVWGGLLEAGATIAADAAARGEIEAARAWLLVREFRPATRETLPTAQSTVALDNLARGLTTPDAAAETLRSDLRDTYHALLLATLEDAASAARDGLELRAAEASGAAVGYWWIIRPAYVAQVSEASAQAVDATLAGLLQAAATADADATALTTQTAAARAELLRFRATDLSPDEQARRAGQLLRFLQLVPVEYGRGVRDGQVQLEIELQEAISFLDASRAALDDLGPELVARDAAALTQIEQVLSSVDARLRDAARRTAVATPYEIQTDIDAALTLLRATMPPEWVPGSSADEAFAVIDRLLDDLQVAAAAGEFRSAESLRLEAYANFDLGPELRLLGFAPGLVQRVDGLFWHGYDGTEGLATLLSKRATPEEIATTRTALDAALADADTTLRERDVSNASVAMNAAIIVFREGLEAVLIFASMLAGMVGANARYKRPLVGGAWSALLATAVTWLLLWAVLSSLRQYGEKLEAIVSLVAVAVLLLILNWFFHNVYWSRWIQRFHGRRRKLAASSAATGAVGTGQALGFVMLGFTSVYREGFETALFLQALVLDAGAIVVLEGVALGLAATVAVGVLVFKLQAKLPYKKLLIATGLLIVMVLITMVGNTVHVMQAIGWLPVNPLPGVSFPYWMGLWLGLFPTWEGVILQVAAVVFVGGSYVAAEWLKQRELRQARVRAAAASASAVGSDSR